MGIPFFVGEWLVEPDLNRISRAYKEVQIEPKGMDLLGDLLSRPADLSVKGLLIDPVWKPLRELPRFNQLVALSGR